MVHLRIVVPSHHSQHALDLLKATPSCTNVVYLPRAAQKPEGDVILCDIAREDTSVIISDLRELDIDKEGSIAIELVDSAVSEVARQAEEAAVGLPSDAVVWEEVESRTSENTELSTSFLAFMVIAMLIAAVGIYLDQQILVIGAMIVGPEFGPLAGLMVAIVEYRGQLAKRSLAALAVGFPVGILTTAAVTLVLKWTSIAPDAIEERPLTDFISHPDFFSAFVAYLAGVAGVLSLTSAKSGALIGVLVSVVTIPAAANVGVAAAYADWGEFGGALAQLAINLGAIVLAGVTTLFLQRRYYVARRRRHFLDESREVAGLPIGHSRRSGPALAGSATDRSAGSSPPGASGTPDRHTR
jgi:uncharacterized hydrophobic protein (TIGR00271 family)